MDESRVKGLLASAGKAISRLPQERYDETVARMRAARSRSEFARELDDLDLHFAREARGELRGAADGDRWEDARGRLLKAAEQHRMERTSPSS